MTSFDVGLLTDRPIRETADIVERAEGLGFDGAWLPDSQSVFREGYLALTAAAAQTRRVRLASGVSNPVTRHPAVIASTFATLDEYSGGRAVLGIGTGDSSLNMIGQRPAKLARLEEVVLAVKSLMRGEEVEIDGAVNRLPWSAREVPVVVSASGPKTLQLAGRIADGALFQVGAEPALASWAIANIRAGAKAAGRDPASVRIMCRIACSVGDDREQARDQVRGYASVAAHTTLRSVPAELIAQDLATDLVAMNSRYDYSAHGSNSSIQSGLITDRIIDAIAIAGSPQEVIPRLQKLIDLDIDEFVLVTSGHDPIASMQAMAVEVLPHLNLKSVRR